MPRRDTHVDFGFAHGELCEDENALDQAMHVLVYDTSDMREKNARDAHARLSEVLNDRRFRRNLANARNNWLGANVDKVISGILQFFRP